MKQPESVSAGSGFCNPNRAPSYIFQKSFLYATFDDSCRSNIVLVVELAADDRSLDFFGCIDDFLDTWYTLGYTHTSNASKVESLQRHLRARFSDRLSSYRPNSMARFCLSFLKFLNAGFDEGP